MEGEWTIKKVKLADGFLARKWLHWSDLKDFKEHKEFLWQERNSTSKIQMPMTQSAERENRSSSKQLIYSFQTSIQE